MKDRILKIGTHFFHGNGNMFDSVPNRQKLRTLNAPLRAIIWLNFSMALGFVGNSTPRMHFREHWRFITTDWGASRFLEDAIEGYHFPQFHTSSKKFEYREKKIVFP